MGKGRRLDSWVIGLGLGCFGSAAGLIAALSFAAGASTSLMTSMFSFVGGTILSYSAFKVPLGRIAKAAAAAQVAPPAAASGDIEPGEASRLDVFRVGMGLGTFSVGLIAGVIAGMWIRYTDPLHFRYAGLTPVAASEGPARAPASSSVTHADESAPTIASKPLADDRPVPVDRHAAGSAAEVGLHHGEQPRQSCDRVRGRLDTEFYHGAGALAEATADLHDLVALCPESR